MKPIKGHNLPYPWLWIGTWSMGGQGFGPYDASDAIDVLSQSYDAGIRHFDTAAFYGNGQAEQLLSKVFGKIREQIFYASKGGLHWEGKKVRQDASPKALRQDLDNSLKNLKTDYLDLFQLHWPDPETPLGDSLEALASFQEKGLIRHWGVCNLDADLVKMLPPDSHLPHQVHHNLLHNSDPILEAGKEENRCINCIISPLEQGLLGNGKSATGSKGITANDYRNKNPYFKSSEIQEWVQKFRSQCDKDKVSPVTLAIQWLVANPNVDVVIPGPRYPAQLKEILIAITSLDER